MFAPHTPSTPISPTDAEALLAGDICVWCDDAPKAATSHLCDECRPQDTAGVLRRAFPLSAITP
jgi:hypothetical protein